MGKNIILIGMMGCGKSTIGRLLAQVLEDFAFVDTDEEIEKTAQMTIPEIFMDYGESSFRELESGTIKRFCARENQVISTGGGCVESIENIDALKESGIVFYLKASADTIFERVKHTNDRPMLYDEDPKKKLKMLLKRREPMYQSADFVIDTENRTEKEIVEELRDLYYANR